MNILLVLLILTTAILLFATEWLRMDLVALLVLLALAVTGQVTMEQAFSGFSNPAVVTVGGMFVLSAAIANTGATTKLGEKLVAIAGTSEPRLIAMVMLSVSLFSAFINNIGSTAVLLPLVIGLAKKVKLPPSKLLIPLAFGSLLGGVCTLIGTPPNILMDTLLKQYAGESFRMFDFAPVGLAIVTAGILYMTFIGRHLLPHRKSGTLTEAYQVKEYITEVAILQDSPLAGKTIRESSLEDEFGLKVRAILRKRVKIPFPRTNHKLQGGDILFLEGDPEGILKVREKKGLEVVPERDNPQTTANGRNDVIVVEASLTPTSEMVGKTLREVRFADTHGLTVLAIWRRGTPVVRKVDHVVLRFGDVLLLQGGEEKVMHLGQEHGFLLLGGVPAHTYVPHKAPLAIAILLGVVLLAATGLLPIMVSATLGAVAMVLARCLTPREAYESIDWSIIILIAGTLPLGLALENSGAARLLADLIIGSVGPLGPWVVLAALFLLTSLLTEAMSHTAAAVLVAPIAFNTALDLGVDPKPFFMAVAVAASSCFMTPVSHQSNALVMGPGGYRFFDYTRVGAALNFIIWILATLLIPLIFPFNPS